MRTRSLLIIIILMTFLLVLPSCKKKGHAALTVTIGNQVVEYKYWSIEYDVTWAETAGYDCTVFQDQLSIVDGTGAVLYSYSFPVNIPVAANSTASRHRAGILIGMYAFNTKPVVLRHTAHYTDTGTGDVYTASGEIVIHDN